MLPSLVYRYSIFTEIIPCLVVLTQNIWLLSSARATKRLLSNMSISLLGS